MLLLHTCCADCALKLTAALEAELKITPADIALYFYNPNIHPESEFHARRQALQNVFKDKGYQVIIAPWQPAHFFNALTLTPEVEATLTSGVEIPGVSRRCPICWQLRLERTFTYAKANGFTQVSTTLLSSKYHDIAQITQIGNTLAQESGLEFVIPHHIDKDASHAGFYKQNYAGCVYSLLEKLHAKYVPSDTPLPIPPAR